MISSLLSRFRKTSTPGAYKRYLVTSGPRFTTPNLSCSFIRAFVEWSDSQVTQSRNRSHDRIPPVDEFILMRRATIGGAMVEGLNISRMRREIYVLIDVAHSDYRILARP